MISPELARRVRLLQIRSRRAVRDLLGGEYHSAFRGRGIEFAEVREYTPGDDVRAIDWNVTARTGRPFIKRYIEERELTVLLVVDVSASGSFASGDQSKQETAAELCALFAFSAIGNNDKVGLLLFSDRIEKFTPPKKGSSHVLRLIRDLLRFEPKGRGTDLEAALGYLGRVTHKRAVIFVVSDFLAKDYERRLQTLARRHDVIAVAVTDPREERLPDVGLIALEDAETGERVIVDSSRPSVRRAWVERAQERSARRREIFRSRRIDAVEVRPGEDYVRDLLALFRRRERRH